MARRYRKRRRRRSSRRRRRFAAKPILFGKHKCVKLRTCVAGALGVSSQTVGGTRFVCISFSANAGGTPFPLSPALRPAGFDLLQPMFANAFTLGSKISVTWLPNTSTHSIIPWIETSTANLVGLRSPDLEQVLNNKFISYGMYATGAGNSSLIKRTRRFSTKKWFSVADVKDNEDLSQILSSTGAPPTLPVRNAYYNVGASMTHNMTDTTMGQLDYVVQIEYVVLFTEPRNVA